MLQILPVIVRYMPIFAAVASLVFVLLAKLIGWELEASTLVSVISIPVLTFIVTTTIRMELFDESQKRLRNQLSVVTDILSMKCGTTNAEERNELYVLESTHDFYRACNIARELSSKTIHVMKIHNVGPQDKKSFVDDGVEVSEIGDKAEAERKKWYSGVREWNELEGRYFERISVKTGQSIEDFLKEVKLDMQGTNYATHIMPWDGCMPVLNLCVFDRREVIFNFSTQAGEAPYAQSNIVGMRIVNSKVADFFYTRYYQRMVQFCRNSTSPDES